MHEQNRFNKVSKSSFIHKAKTNAKKGSAYIKTKSKQRPYNNGTHSPNSNIRSSLERNEPWGVGSTNTRPTVLNRLVWDGELSQVVTNHLRLDLDLVKRLSVVHSNDASNHLWDNDHVPQVGSHWLWLLTLWCLPFLFIKIKHK